MLSKQDSVLGVSLRGLNHQTCIYLGHGKVPSHPVVPSSLMRFQPKEPETLRKLTLVYLLPTPFTMLALYLLVFAWDRLMRGTRAVNGAAPPPPVWLFGSEMGRHMPTKLQTCFAVMHVGSSVGGCLLNFMD